MPWEIGRVLSEDTVSGKSATDIWRFLWEEPLTSLSFPWVPDRCLRAGSGSIVTCCFPSWLNQPGTLGRRQKQRLAFRPLFFCHCDVTEVSPGDVTQIPTQVPQVRYRRGSVSTPRCLLTGMRMWENVTEKGCSMVQHRLFQQTPNVEEPTFQTRPHKSLTTRLCATEMEDGKTALAGPGLRVTVHRKPS